MQPPSIALTLVVSFALSVAALSYVQDIARGAQDPAAAAARQCDGYRDLHLLLGSADDAERFLRDTDCTGLLSKESDRKPAALRP